MPTKYDFVIHSCQAPLCGTHTILVDRGLIYKLRSSVERVGKMMHCGVGRAYKLMHSSRGTTSWCSATAARGERTSWFMASATRSDWINVCFGGWRKVGERPLAILHLPFLFTYHGRTWDAAGQQLWTSLRCCGGVGRVDKLMHSDVSCLGHGFRCYSRVERFHGWLVHCSSCCWRCGSV